MTVGEVHRISLTATVLLPSLGLLGGSTVLHYATLLYAGAVVLGIFGLHQVVRGRLRTWGVHLSTVIVFILSLSQLSYSPIDAALIVVMAGIINRFYLRSGQRDDLIMVGAAGVLLTAVTIVTPGITFAIIVILFMPSVLWAMLSASILGLSDRWSHPSERARKRKELADRPAPALSWTLSSWGLLLMLIGYIAVSFIPRYRFAQYFTAGGLVNFSNVGTRMELSTGGVRTRSYGTVALRVYGINRRNYAVEGLYARLHVLDQFDGRNFTDSQGRVTSHPSAHSEQSEGCTTLVALHRQASRYEPHPVAVLGRSHPTRVYMPRVQSYASGTWVKRIPSGALDIRYRSCLDSRPPAPIPQDKREADIYMARYLDVPDSLDERIYTLAKKIAGDEYSPERITERLLSYFSGTFSYQLDGLKGTSDDPLVRFLFEAKSGHCELFAGAMVVLLRINGIPARVAAGYYGGHVNRPGRQLEFTSDDAHAWVEVLIDGYWRWVDATPERERTRRRGMGFVWLMDIWNALESWWYEYIIDFDDERRRAMITRLQNVALSPREWMSRPALLGQHGQQHLRRYFSLTGLVVGVLFVVGAGVLRRQREHRRVRRLGLKLRQSLGGGPEPLGVLAAAQPATLEPMARRVVELYESYRYGPDAHRPNLGKVQQCMREWLSMRARHRSRQSREI
ncbi:MAG: DUF3488 and transglutaminase-like domain-containing protein [Myxococcales bacterium]|nr:DUF3488 and transglutaminase-like domain-containing protein [Myxococcales bacterium]